MTSRPRLVFPLAAWRGPSGVTLIQGLNRDPVTGDYFITQADDVAGSSVQDVVIRRHRANLSYADSRTIRKAGHGSSIGLENDGQTMLWLGHSTHGLGRFDYAHGEKSFTRSDALPDGDAAVHRDVICIRNSNRYRGYRLSDAKAGKTTRLFDFTIAAWGKRFQGHEVVSTGPGTGLVLVHRDVATKAASKAVAYTFDGTRHSELDTTRMGDEAEGFLVETDAKGTARVWIVKRTGPADSRRTVVATLWIGSLPVKPTVPAKTDTIATVLARLGKPTAMRLSSLLKARDGKYLSRYTYYAQLWLHALGYYRDTADGRWGKYTQAAYDMFRAGIRPSWRPSDCVGPPGMTSLTLLRNAAVKATGKDQLAVRS
jgi:hypothetical protein